MKDKRLYVIWIWRSALCLLGLCLLLETATRIGFSRISHIESRIASEHHEALAVRKSAAKTTFLLLGNSLALEGVALPQLRSRLGASADVARFVVEATEYLDWYYGVRRLLAEGSDPDVVLLCLDSTHLKSSGIRGDYSAFYLFQTKDVASAARAAHYDLTKTAGLFLARYSLFYAGRTGLRNFVLNHVDNPYAEMVRNLPKPVTLVPRQAAPKSDAFEVYVRRLADLREQCAAYHKRLIFLLPPGNGKDEAQLKVAAEKAHVDLFIPVHQNEFGSDLYRDGYHVNAEGASIFTGRLADRLNSYLDRVH